MTLSPETPSLTKASFSEVSEIVSKVGTALETLEKRCQFLETMDYPPEFLRWSSTGFPCKYSDSEGNPQTPTLKKFDVPFFCIGKGGNSLSEAIQTYLEDLARVLHVLDLNPKTYITIIFGNRLELVWSPKSVILRTKLAYILEEGKE
jgi:hypothetical protein